MVDWERSIFLVLLVGVCAWSLFGMVRVVQW